MTTTVLICDDAGPVRDELRRFVAQVPGVDRVDAVQSGEEVLARWPLDRPRLVLMGVRSSGGLGAVETTRRLMRAHPDATVVMLSTDGDDVSVAEAIAGGARGFLTKGLGVEQVSAAVAGALAVAEVPRQPGYQPLTERELQVLRGMAEGRSNAEIGRELFLSEDTVKTHARRLFRKLGVRDRAQAVALGFRMGLVS